MILTDLGFKQYQDNQGNRVFAFCWQGHKNLSYLVAPLSEKEYLDYIKSFDDDEDVSPYSWEDIGQMKDMTFVVKGDFILMSGTVIRETEFKEMYFRV